MVVDNISVYLPCKVYKFDYDHHTHFDPGPSSVRNVTIGEPVIYSLTDKVSQGLQEADCEIDDYPLLFIDKVKRWKHGAL